MQKLKNIAPALFTAATTEPPQDEPRSSSAPAAIDRLEPAEVTREDESATEDKAGSVGHDHPDEALREHVSVTAEAGGRAEGVVVEYSCGEAADENTNEESSDVMNPDIPDDTLSAGDGTTAAVPSLKHRRRAARAALKVAWSAREAIRKTLLGNWTFTASQALSRASSSYNEKRSELAQTMVSGELNEQDAKEFPYVYATDLSKPLVKPTGISSRHPSGKLG